MYPYPSGDLHIGHWYIVTPSDALARFRRMHGYNVFFPIGFDAFGLPAENAAIKNGGHPFTWTMAEHREHAAPVPHDGRDVRLGARGRHRRPVLLPLEPVAVPAASWRTAWRIAQKSPVDWCPNDGTLAREQVEGADRRCWRCGALVEKRDLDQWYLRTTAYADELLDVRRHRLARADQDPADELDRPLRGRGDRLRRRRPSDHQPGGDELRVFTTRPDTLFGATFMVLAPEHPLVADADRARSGAAEVEAYVDAGAPAHRDRAPVDRSREDRRRHRRRRDQPGQRRADPDLHRRLRAGRLRHGRDHGRARPRRARLRVRASSSACRSGASSPRRAPRPTTPMADAYVAHAAGERLVNSGPFDGHAGRRGRQGDRRRAGRGTGKAEPKVTYRLRDWLISRQRYWGTPIPVVYCDRRRHRAGARRGPAGAAARGRRLPRQRRRTR